MRIIVIAFARRFAICSEIYWRGEHSWLAEAVPVGGKIEAACRGAVKHRKCAAGRKSPAHVTITLENILYGEIIRIVAGREAALPPQADPPAPCRAKRRAWRSRQSGA